MEKDVQVFYFFKGRKYNEKDRYDIEQQ